jgi:putative transposase
MDEKHLVEGMRYVEMNPVRAGLVKRAWDYRWSSAKAHIRGEGDELVKAMEIKEELGDWKGYLKMGKEEEEWERIRQHERTGRPMGDERFIERLEKRLNRDLRKQKPGRKKGS